MKLSNTPFILLTFLLFCSMTFGQVWNVQEIKKLSSSINNEEAEESIPLFSKELGKLFFVRSTINEEQSLTAQNIFESKRNSDGEYTSATELSNFNNEYNNAILGLSQNGTKVFLLDAYNKKGNPGIASSMFSNGKWSTPERVEIPNLKVPNTLFGFHITQDEKVIIMSYAGTNSLGEEDLFISTNTNGSWSEPIHLGGKVNSAGFEISPFLSLNKDTLFFSSNGFGGLGDADIFYSVKGNSWTDWSKPVNLGAPINSENFDAYFSYYDHQILWASNRGERLSDVYTATFKNTAPLAVDLIAINSSEFNANDGSIKMNISGGIAPYSVEWMDGIKTNERNNLKAGEYLVNVTDKTGATTTKKITITEPKQERIALSYTHFFDYNAVAVNKDKKILELLENIKTKISKDKTIITVTSSASQVPTSKYQSNVQLAEKRANELTSLINRTIGKQESVEVKSNAIVSGPAYENDASNKEKYQKFQFVTISIE